MKPYPVHLEQTAENILVIIFFRSAVSLGFPKSIHFMGSFRAEGLHVDLSLSDSGLRAWFIGLLLSKRYFFFVICFVF